MVNSSKMYYQQFGEGTPVLFLHGFPEDHRSIVGSLESLFKNQQGFKRIYPDLPGMGKSPVNPKIRNADDMLATLSAFIDLIIGDKPFLLVGQSYGGYLSLGLMYQRSESIAGVFLICPCIIGDRRKRNLPVQAKKVQPSIEFSADIDKEEFADFLSMTELINETTWRRYREEILPGLQSADKTFIESYQGEGYSFSFESEFGEMTFDAPVFILASKQDYCVGFEDAYKIGKKLPNASYFVVNRAGHNLLIEQPEVLETSLLSWLGNFIDKKY